MRFVSRRAAFPPLGLLTVAAMLPKSWHLRLIDMDVNRLRDADLLWADYVLVSAMIVHRQSVDDEVIPRCHQFGKPIVAGGPLFTTGYDAYAENVHAAVGECEDTIDRVIADMERGALADKYESDCGFPNIARTPVPRWDLVRMRDYATMSIQFSRGCPFDCEFCDIIVMNGRKPRTKSPMQAIAELDALVTAGWRGTVFFVDDNFIGNKRHVKELLQAIIDWRHQRRPQIDFITEASVNLADDVELMELMTRAGFRSVFLGIETPVSASLEECKKVQNSHGDLADKVRTIQRSGLQVMGGFIVGFDNDPPNIFQLQFDFIQKAGIATAMVGLLSALPKTRLYQRLLGEGRLDNATSGNNTEAVLNFRPMLDREFLTHGYKRLMQSLYEPSNYYRRVLVLLSEYRPRGPKLRTTWGDVRAFAKSLWIMGIVHHGRWAFWKYLTTVLMRHPRKLRAAITLAVHGFHYRMVAKGL